MISQLIEMRTIRQCRNKLDKKTTNRAGMRIGGSGRTEEARLTCADVVAGVLLVLRKTMASTASDNYAAFFDAVVAEVGTFGLSESEKRIRKIVRKVEKKLTGKILSCLPYQMIIRNTPQRKSLLLLARKSRGKSSLNPLSMNFPPIIQFMGHIKFGSSKESWSISFSIQAYFWIATWQILLPISSSTSLALRGGNC